MKQLLLLLISIPFFLIAQGSGIKNSSDKPVKPINSSISWKALAKLTPQEYEKLTGKKLKFKERIGLKILKWKAKRMAEGKPTDQQKKLGRISLIFGIIGIICLFIPVGVIVILGAALGIAGLIVGLKSIKGNSNVPGIIGVVLSCLILLAFLVAIAFVAAYAGI